MIVRVFGIIGFKMTKIKSLWGLEVLDSRGNPTVQANLQLDDDRVVTALVPSGASTGEHEALELRDGDPKRYGGLGVQKALANLQDEIAPALVGKDPTKQQELDDLMISLDGTPDKSNLGANAILAASMAITRAGALAVNLPLYAYIGTFFAFDPQGEFILPLPMMNVLNGGKHAKNSIDMQELMISPQGLDSFPEVIRAGSEIFHTLGKILAQRGLATTVGDEGGYAPHLASHTQALDLLMQAITLAGYLPGKQVRLALDPAASEFFDEHGLYHLSVEHRQLKSEEMIAFYQLLVNDYPIYSLEDGLAQDDWQSWSKLNSLLGDKLQLVGDDLLVTNVARLQTAINRHACNSILIKVNQIGSVSESLAAIKLAKQHGFISVISHRSGETEDTFVADLAVGSGVGQIKTGSLSRSERVAKYNRLLQINQELGERARLAKL